MKTSKDIPDTQSPIIIDGDKPPREKHYFRVRNPLKNKTKKVNNGAINRSTTRVIFYPPGSSLKSIEEVRALYRKK